MQLSVCVLASAQTCSLNSMPSQNEYYDAQGSVRVACGSNESPHDSVQESSGQLCSARCKIPSCNRSALASKQPSVGSLGAADFREQFFPHVPPFRSELRRWCRIGRDHTSGFSQVALHFRKFRVCAACSDCNIPKATRVCEVWGGSMFMKTFLSGTFCTPC